MARNKIPREKLAFQKQQEKEAKRAAHAPKPRWSKDRNEYILTFNYTLPSGQKKRKHFYGKDEETCYQKLAEFKFDLMNNTPKDVANMTIPELVKFRNDTQLSLNKIKESTYVRNMDAAKSIEASSIGKLPIRKLNNQKIKNYLTTIVGYSQSNIDKLYSALTQAFAVAFELNVINENPFLKNTLLLQKPKSRKKPKEIHAFDNETTERFLKCIYEYVPKANCFDYSKQCIISLLLGLRMGEVNGLKPEDVDFDNELLHIERTVSKDLNYKPVLDNNPKTYKSKRVIPLNPQVAIILKEAIKNMRKNEDGLIFYNWKSCRPFSTKEVNDFFTDFCNKNGIKSDGCHMLRHTYASNSIQNNVNPFMLRELMGHESIDITLGTYAKFFDKNKKDAVNNYNTYINDLLAKIK